MRLPGGKTTVRCPACAEAGHDQTRNHLFIWADGRFGCVVYSGDSPDAKAHRRRVFALCGTREIKPLIVRRTRLGRLGRVDESHSEGSPVRTGLLGRVGRLFQTYLGTEQAHERKEDRKVEKLNDRERGIPGVLSAPAVKPRRPLTEGEWTILVRAGAVNEAIIIEALRLFDARVVE
jgi:hypothetical protein